jgi:hypothetical protein
MEWLLANAHYPCEGGSTTSIGGPGRHPLAVEVVPHMQASGEDWLGSDDVRPVTRALPASTQFLMSNVINKWFGIGQSGATCRFCRRGSLL